MTQAGLTFDLEPITTRTYRDRVAELFRRRAGEWIDGLEIAQVGGVYAYRTRISDCRLQLGMRIDNRLRKVGARTVSEYRLVLG